MQHPHLHRNLSLLGTAALLGAAAAWSLVSCAWGPEAAGIREGTWRPGPEYVGSATCRRCHRDQHARWSGSSHANTFVEANAATLPPEVVACETVGHPPGRTRFRREGGRYLAETIGPDGKPFPYHLTHVVGRMRIRMFIATLPDGRMQVLPAMLEVPTGEWFDYTHLIFGAGGTDWDRPPVVKPGDPSFWTGPVRSWDRRCARCHVSGWQFQRPDENGHGPRYTSRTRGIDCEQCHGPGSAHVAHRKSDRPGVDPILRYASLSHSQAVGMCLQCHMEAEVVSTHFEVGDDIFEFRDPTLLIDPEEIDPSGRSLELVYDGVPFSVSRCVKEGRLTCLTCHDPHGSGHRSQLRRPPGDDSLCTTCHGSIARDLRKHTHHDPAGAGSRCVNCHMPFLTIERGHGVIADHSISTPRFDLKGDRVAISACTWCHQGGLMAPEGAPRLARSRLQEAHAGWYGGKADAKPWMQAIGAARLREKGAHADLVKVLEDTSLRRVVRASAAQLLSRYAREALPAILEYARDHDSLVRRRAVGAMAGLQGEEVDAALLRATADESLAVRVAAARAALEGWHRVQNNEALREAILPILEASAKDGPEDPLRWFLLGGAREIHGDYQGAIAAYERVCELEPFQDHLRKTVVRLKTKLKEPGR